MLEYLKDSLIIIGAFFYKIYMFFNFKYKIKKIRLRQIKNFNKKKLKERYIKEKEKGYKWERLESRIKRIGIVREIRVIQTHDINEWGESEYIIRDGTHRLYFLATSLTPLDHIKVYSRLRTKTEFEISEYITKINKKNQTLKKELKINKPFNKLKSNK